VKTASKNVTKEKSLSFGCAIGAYIELKMLTPPPGRRTKHWFCSHRGWGGGMSSCWHTRNVAAQVSQSIPDSRVVSVWYALHLKCCQGHQELAEGKSVASHTYY